MLVRGSPGARRLAGPDCLSGYEYNPKKERAVSLWLFLTAPEGAGLSFPDWNLEVCGGGGVCTLLPSTNARSSE